MKKIMDLADGAKIFNGDELRAHEMLESFIGMLPEIREELCNAYCARESNPITFRFVVDKLYDGLLYVGAPALRHAANDLLIALDKKEEHTVDELYQKILNEMRTLEEKWRINMNR